MRPDDGAVEDGSDPADDGAVEDGSDPADDGAVEDGSDPVEPSVQIQIAELNASLGMVAQAVIELQSQMVTVNQNARLGDATVAAGALSDNVFTAPRSPMLRLITGSGASQMSDPLSADKPSKAARLPSDCIVTASGRKFYPMDPRGEDVDITDIAHSLGNLCRFTGASRHFYSVAEHCVNVSLVCDPQDALWGLLHDASEFALSDVNTIVKHSPLMAGYRAIEARLARVIFERFELFGSQPSSVSVAEQRMLVTEAQQLMPPSDLFGNAEPVDMQIAGLSPAAATAAFLYRFTELTEAQ